MKRISIYPIYVINLKKRKDRLESIKKEFKDKTEFNVNIVEAIEHPNGAMGLWGTIRSIFCSLKDEDFIIICEDDHQFTNDYSCEYLSKCIAKAEKKDADILLGGVSWFTEAVQITENLFSVEMFSGMQFVVVFRKFFSAILNADFGPDDSADYKAASMSINKLIIYPFISIQKEFGYSDVTSKNNQLGRVTAIFDSSILRLNLLNKIWVSYQFIKKKNLRVLTSNDINKKGIPTYILNFQRSFLNTENVINQFKDKHEFDATLVEIEEQEIDLYGIGCFIQNIIKLAISNDEDLIIICDSTHIFTSDYCKEYLFRNILSALNAGAKIISGGTDQFGSTVAVSDSLFWMDWFTNVQFVVLHNTVFKEILCLPDINRMSLSMIYNIASSNKLIIYPFISKQCSFDHLDSEPFDNHSHADKADVSIETSNRMKFVRDEYVRYFPIKIDKSIL